MKRNILVFGTIAGVLISTFMAFSMSYVCGATNEMNMGYGSMILGFAAMAVAFSFVFVGIKNYRDKQNNGVITFGKGFLLGFMISLIASTMYVLTWAVEYHFFYPDFMAKFSTAQIKHLQEDGVSGAAFDEAVKGIKSAQYKYENNLLFFTIYTYIEILPVGILVTLISALILKRKTPITVVD